ncbi:Neuronal tyrosine-phosphorylated phosphoinositide-3-kinase adapter 1 [Bagarius yarrelli]|uniref:Neuronal tyrosine-phosphorylated phosphoinositide-3-kinase adapter 1 n=1 Tax=Bagarius yarrelli TaxID=175774 RepID=A0A556TYM1_BAGYA|nr:Neuronal tyrosine-phosphorylated phosphoinositide-3-kinase adapter 1 [Bagarius yarrelli]
MNSGSAQNVAVEHFLRDIERRGQRLHCAVIGCEEAPLRGDMNLLYRKSRLDWRHRDQESKKRKEKGRGVQERRVREETDSDVFKAHFSCKDASSATVGKVRDLASFRRHFRMGFMTMPASQDLSPHSCAAAMAPRSQSCHAVGTGEGEGLENGDDPDSDTQMPSNPGRCPPAKPKRHPSTRLSSTSQQEHPARGGHASPDALPPPPPQNPPKHPEKKNAMKKSDSGDLLGRKVPPQKPKRSPSTQLSFDAPPPRLPPPATPLPFQSAESTGDDEPVYIEMVGQVFTRETGVPTPSATTPDSDSDPGEEAIYEEMKYPVADDAHQRRLPPKHDRAKSSKSYTSSSVSSSSTSSSLPRPSSSSPSCPLPSSKTKSAVSISHSSPLPSSSCSASSTPIPQPLSASPHPPRAPTPFLLPGTKSESEIGSSKIPAPFPNLLQHKPPLLAFPPPKSGSSKMSSSSSPSPASLPPTIGTSVSKEATGGDKEKEKKEGPAPGLRARSHSTPLPPSSKSSSPYSHHHHHHHPHHRPSHYHHYRKPEKESNKASQGTSQSSTQTQTQSKEGKSVSFLLKSDKAERERERERERDRDRDRERDRDKERDTPVTQVDMAASTVATTTTSLSSASSSMSSGTSSTSSASQRPPSRSVQRSHTPHTHLPAYKPPPADSPLLWTYPSTGFRRPPAYDSLRAGTPMPSLHPEGSTKSGTTQVPHAKAGFLPWDASRSGLGFTDDQAYWPMHRKLSFSHGSRENDKEDGRVWNGSTDALLKRDREDAGGSGRTGGVSGIPLHALAQAPCSPSLARAHSQTLTQAQAQFHLQQLQQHHLQLQFQHLAQLAAQAQAMPGTGSVTASTASGTGTTGTSSQRDGKLLEVIERKRCLCKEIKAHRRPDKSLCKQDSMPILPSWRKTPEPRKTGTPPCQRPQAVVWDTAI